MPRHKNVLLVATITRGENVPVLKRNIFDRQPCLVGLESSGDHEFTWTNQLVHEIASTLANQRIQTVHLFDRQMFLELEAARTAPRHEDDRVFISRELAKLRAAKANGLTMLCTVDVEVAVDLASNLSDLTVVYGRALELYDNNQAETGIRYLRKIARLEEELHRGMIRKILEARPDLVLITELHRGLRIYKDLNRVYTFEYLDL